MTRKIKCPKNFDENSIIIHYHSYCTTFFSIFKTSTQLVVFTSNRVQPSFNRKNNKEKTGSVKNKVYISTSYRFIPFFDYHSLPKR